MNLNISSQLFYQVKELKNQCSITTVSVSPELKPTGRLSGLCNPKLESLCLSLLMVAGLGGCIPTAVAPLIGGGGGALPPFEELTGSVKFPDSYV